MLVAISAVMLCVNILNQKNPVRVNIIDLIVLLFCSYVLVRDIQSSGIITERYLLYSLIVFLYLIVKTDEKNSIKAIAIGILLCGTIQSTIA